MQSPSDTARNDDKDATPTWLCGWNLPADTLSAERYLRYNGQAVPPTVERGALVVSAASQGPKNPNGARKRHANEVSSATSDADPTACHVHDQEGDGEATACGYYEISFLVTRDKTWTEQSPVWHIISDTVCGGKREANFDVVVDGTTGKPIRGWVNCFTHRMKVDDEYWADVDTEMRDAEHPTSWWDKVVARSGRNSSGAWEPSPSSPPK